MNEFKESLKHNNTKDFTEFDAKITHAVIEAINSVSANDKDEQVRKLEMILNMNRFISNYDSSLEILKESEKKEKRKEKKGMNKYR